MIKVNWREERKHGRVRGRKTILPVPSSLWSSGKWRVGERMEPIYDPVVSGERMEPAYDPVVSGGEDGANLWSSGEWGRRWKTGSRKERETVIQWWVLCRGEDGRQEAGKRGRLWSSGKCCAGERMEDRKQERGSRSQSMIQWWVVRRGEDRRQERGRGSQSMIQWWVVSRGEDGREEAEGEGDKSHQPTFLRQPAILWWEWSPGQSSLWSDAPAHGRCWAMLTVSLHQTPLPSSLHHPLPLQSHGH